MEALFLIVLGIQMVVVAFLFIRGLLLIGKNRGTVLPVFFSFAVFSFLLSDFYWLAHYLIRPGERMPFAANEIAEYALFLLFSAMLLAVFKGFRGSAVKEIILTAVFVAANVALWIAWSGEWVKDIISGIIFGYFLCNIVRSLKLSAALTRLEWIIMAIASLVLICLQTAIFFVPEGIKVPLDIICYVLMFAIILFFLMKSICCLRKENETDCFLSITAAFFGWSVVTMYMSADPMYYGAVLFSLAALVFLFIAVKRKVSVS